MQSTTDEEKWREYHVAPRYLAGSSGVADPGFAPVSHWPHHHLDDGPCQLVVTSPDHRIRIGWFGDDFDLWKITAADDAVSAPRWTAVFNHNTPAEIVLGLTAALADDWSEDSDRFLDRPSFYWAAGVTPLFNAGWKREAAEYGTVEIVSPDGQAGAVIDMRRNRTVTLWAGPAGWGTRAEATFTSDTPPHLIAATAAALVDPAPVVRTRRMIHPKVEHLVQLTPLELAPPRAARAPTPLDVRRIAVTAALQRTSLSRNGTIQARISTSPPVPTPVRTAAATPLLPRPHR
ncbi:DUF317 domain-containing protein [Streptomyces anthocyanicus]|uniref:DUF317 domain-containing protein n=1 Tax=Streptomyces lividans 1326 TaxID=1200984 RepID=A0A7U9H8V5_STRLI|nr:MULTISPECIES: DUF317 domain-containing protein [Streptomyces]EOY45733.1 hypothetical protein SLI_1016 [Streptomyces lividans 1326]KKD10180.1 hypothetical protein TR66_37655 [Streptomyces sp. WM6391]